PLHSSSSSRSCCCSVRTGTEIYTLSLHDALPILDGAPAWESYELTEPRSIPVTADTAALVYRATAHRGDLPEPFTALMSSLYTRIDGRPRLVLYQQTAIP